MDPDTVCSVKWKPGREARRFDPDENAGMLRPEESTTVVMHREICAGLTGLYAKKNHDYGDSFHKTFLEEGFAMSRIRLSDKLERFKNLSRNETKAQVVDESIEDTLLDLANYAIMTVIEMRRKELES